MNPAFFFLIYLFFPLGTIIVCKISSGKDCMGEPFKIGSVNLFDAVLILWLAQDSGSGPGGAG